MSDQYKRHSVKSDVAGFGVMRSIKINADESGLAAYLSLTDIPDVATKHIERTAADGTDIDKDLTAVHEALEGLDKQLENLLIARAAVSAHGRILEGAKKLRAATIPEPSESDNSWKEGAGSGVMFGEDPLLNEDIYNQAFRGQVIICSKHSWPAKSATGVQVEYIARWYLYNRLNGDILENIQRKFATEEEARKYIEGRKGFMEKNFFTESNPVIPLKYEHSFLVERSHIPAYRYESTINAKEA